MIGLLGAGQGDFPGDLIQLHILQMRVPQEIQRGLGGGGIARRAGGFQQNPHIGRLALHLPVGLRQPEGRPGLMQQFKRITRLLALMHKIPAQMTRLKPRLE